MQNHYHKIKLIFYDWTNYFSYIIHIEIGINATNFFFFEVDEIQCATGD